MKMNVQHFAPCGMNCGTCLAYLRARNRCNGCRNKNETGYRHPENCSILNCTFLAQTDSKFCYDCEIYPCRRLNQIDKRYRTKYKVSFIENLESIKTMGLDAFRIREEAKWACPDCGGTICVHRGYCLECKN